METNSYASRLDKIRKGLKRRRLDAMLITSEANRFYLSGFGAEDMDIAESAGALLILQHDSLLLTDGRYEIQAREEAQGWKVILYPKGLPLLLKRLNRKLGIRRMGYEPGYITCKQLNTIQEKLKEVTFIPWEGTVEKMRAIKTEPELKIIEEAVYAAEKAFAHVANELKPGMKENEVAWKISKKMSEYGARPSFPPIVASGPNGALPHAEPGEREIRPGEPVIIDLGAKLKGYCSDMTRTIFCGPPPKDFKEIYKVVKTAQVKAIKNITGGMTCKEADSLARNTIEEAGFGKYFVHALGHGVGIKVHETPALSRRSRKRLKPGMVITVEPGIYIPGKGGVRLEVMGVVTKEGLKVLGEQKWFYDF